MAVKNNTWRADNYSEMIMGDFPSRKFIYIFLLRITSILMASSNGITICLPFILSLYLFKYDSNDLGYLDNALAVIFAGLGIILVLESALWIIFNTLGQLKIVSQYKLREYAYYSILDRINSYHPLYILLIRLYVKIYEAINRQTVKFKSPFPHV